MSDISETIRLARAFGEQIQDSLNVSQFRLVCDMNNGDTSGACHTHDFVDANVLMQTAFIETFKRDPLDTPDGHMTDADLQLINNAWAIAKAADFFA